MSNSSDFVIENGVLTQYNGPGGAVTIPAGVTEIDWRAFRNCTGLTSVTIPAGVKEIGDEAFRGCTNLTSAAIPAGVTRIGAGAFLGCTSLTGLTLPASVTEIDECAFLGCPELANQQAMVVFNGILFYHAGPGGDVVIPEEVTEIGRLAFWGCADLQSITIPASVTRIDAEAFLDCTGLTSVTIPASVTEIGWGAFRSCTGLTSVTIPAGVEIGDSAFCNCPKLADKEGMVIFNGILFDYTGPGGDVTIPAGVTEISSFAFHCKNLTSVTIPAEVTKIWSKAFSDSVGQNRILTIRAPAGSAAAQYAYENQDQAFGDFDITEEVIQFEALPHIQS